MTDLDTAALRQAGQDMRKNRGVWVPDMTLLEQAYHGNLKYAFDVEFKTPEGSKGQLHHDNRQGREVSPDIKAGDRWPFSFNGESVTIERVDCYVPAAAIQAQNDIAEARRKTEAFDQMSIQDVDALEDIPDRLASALEGSKRAIKFFHDGAGEMLQAQQIITNNKWQGSGAQAYWGALGIQHETFSTCEKDLTALSDLQVAMGNAVLDVCKVLAELYLRNIDKMASQVKEAYKFVGGGWKSWTTYADKIVDLGADIYKKEGQNFKSSIDKLQAQLEAGHMISKAENIKMESWPVPNGVITEPWN